MAIVGDSAPDFYFSFYELGQNYCKIWVVLVLLSRTRWVINIVKVHCTIKWPWRPGNVWNSQILWYSWVNCFWMAEQIVLVLRKEDTLCCSVLLITFGNSGLCHFSASLSHIVNIVNVKFVENSKHQSMIMAVDVRGRCWSAIQCAHFTICILCLIRPHRSTTYVDVAYSYRPRSMVCRSVCHASEPCKNSWTDRDAIWVVDSGGPKKACK